MFGIHNFPSFNDKLWRMKLMDYVQTKIIPNDCAGIFVSGLLRQLVDNVNYGFVLSPYNVRTYSQPLIIDWNKTSYSSKATS